MSIKITLDPGHGKNANGSPYVPAYYEGNQMFYLAQKLKGELEKHGFEVLITRQKITDDPSLAERGATAGNNDCRMFLSLHSNAPGVETAEDGSKYYPESCTGTVVFYSMTRQENKDLADRLGKAVSDAMGHYFRGSKTREYQDRPGVDYYGVLRNAAQSGCTCAILIEHGFHTHIADAEFLLKDENMQKLAEIEAGIIAEYFGATQEPVDPGEINVGSVVKILAGATYWGGQNVPSWVREKKWIVEAINKGTGRAVINKEEGGKSSIMSPIDVKYLALAYPPKEETPADPVVEEPAPADPISETLTPDDEIKITIRRYGEAFQIVERDKLAEFLK